MIKSAAVHTKLFSKLMNGSTRLVDLLIHCRECKIFISRVERKLIITVRLVDSYVQK